MGTDRVLLPRQDTKGWLRRPASAVARTVLVYTPQRKFHYVLSALGVLSAFYCLLLLHRTSVFKLNRLKAFDFLFPEDVRELQQGEAQAARAAQASGAYLIDTPGCRILAMAPRSKEVEGFLYDYEGMQCGDPPPLVESNDTAVFVVPEALAAHHVTARGLSCCYTAMWRHDPHLDVPEWEPELGSGEPVGPLYDAKLYGNDIRFANECVEFKDSALIEHEFVHVKCSAGSRLVYEDYHAFVPLKVPSGVHPGEDVHWSESSLNVIIVGVDAVSRLNLLRTMPRTAALLADTLRATGMLGFNKVEDNTFPNMVPLFTGFSVQELGQTCWTSKDAHFDACPWIWRRFNRHGYVNAFAEDTAWMGLFHYLKRGFINQPTDYDARPLLYLGERNLGRGKGLNAKICIGQRFQIEVLFEYAAKFVRKMHQHSRKFFGHFWGTSLSHDYLNQPDEADTLYFSFLSELMQSGVLNTSALVFMSDHGLRWGNILSTFQGRLEERLPFLHLVLPDWFRLRYPSAIRNLEDNAAGRLVTVYDLHETLLDFLDVRVLEAPRLERSAAAVRDAYRRAVPPRGISLFVPVPPERTCAAAGVPRHFCACQHLRRAAVSDPTVREVADLVVQHINGLLQVQPQCQQLSLMDVHDAWLGQPLADVNVTDAKFREHEYQVTVHTLPGLGLFSATIRHNLDTKVMQIAGTVTRLNAYGKQSWCTTDSALRLFCYCQSDSPS